MTSNRVKAAARRLQAEENIPYAEALRRVTGIPAPARRTPPVEHECVRGLWLTDVDSRRKVCPRCATDSQKARVVAVQKAVRDLKIIRAATLSGAWRGAGWPYGPNIDVDSREELVAWAGPHGLRASSTFRSCLHWLQQIPCPRDRSGMCAEQIPGADHVSAWNRGSGKNSAVLVSQPYTLDLHSRARLAELNASPDLKVDIDDAGGWYGHGTVFVAIWRVNLHGTPPNAGAAERSPRTSKNYQVARRPGLRLACCKCRRQIPLKTDVYALDAEWQRRYPDMVGILACARCTLETSWSCLQDGSRRYVDGHIPAIRDGHVVQNCDSWGHVLPKYGTQSAMVWTHPWSGLLQGAEGYLRSKLARHSGASAQGVPGIEEALARWEADST